MMAFFKPDHYLTSVLAIDLGDLGKRGYKSILLDLDNTLLPRGTTTIPEEIALWVAEAKACGFAICLISNNWHAEVFSHAEDLGVPLVYKAMKPASPAILHAMRKIGAQRTGTVLIGDQLLTDVVGAHLLGIHAIMVQPLADIDLKHTLFLRRIEKLIMKDAKPTR